MRRVPLTLREPVNALTHWLGVVLALPLLAVLLGWAQSRSRSLWPFVVFGVSFAVAVPDERSLPLLPGSARILTWLRKFDHSPTFLLIASSDTPVAYLGLSGELRWRLLGVVWGLAGTGILLKLITMRLPRWTSTALDLGMGWLAAFVLPQRARS